MCWPDTSSAAALSRVLWLQPSTMPRWAKSYWKRVGTQPASLAQGRARVLSGSALSFSGVCCGWVSEGAGFYLCCFSVWRKKLGEFGRGCLMWGGRRSKMMVQLFSKRGPVLPQHWKPNTYWFGTNMQGLYQFSVQGLGTTACEGFGG